MGSVPHFGSTNLPPMRSNRATAHLNSNPLSVFENAGGQRNKSIMFAPRGGEDRAGETSRMNRFLSKLDLRDIKIDPEGSRFPPDADERAAVVAEASEASTEVQSVPDLDTTLEEVPLDLIEESAPIDVSTWESPTFGGNGPDPAQEQAPIIQSDIVLETSPEPIVSAQPVIGVEGVIVGSDGEVLKVSARSRPSAVAGAIAGVVREAGRAEVQAIGAGATNQAVKAVAIARDYLRETGIDAICVPAFIDVTIDNEDRTAIRLVVEPR